MNTPSIYDLYEFYLEPKDLRDKAHVVKVESVRVDNVINPRARKPEKKIILKFENRRKSMILNKTQAGDVSEIAKTDDYTKWKGVELVLVSGRASNGRDTIVVTTRELSGDADLAFSGPAGWCNALGTTAVDIAADAWKCGQAEAYARIKRALDEEALSQSLPLGEFKEWVASCTR